MNKKALYQRYQQHTKDFKKYFKRSKKKQDIEDIHQMRLAVKKQRAILSLLEYCTNGKFDKTEHFKVYAPLFSSAGEVREGQVNTGIVDKEKKKKIKRYQKYLKQTQRKDVKALLKVSNKFRFKRLERLDVRLKKQFARISNKKLNRKSEIFLKDKLNKVKKLNGKAKKGNNLHKVRIELKQVGELLELQNGSISNKKNKKQLRYVTDINHLLGEWHDNVVLSASLHDFANKKKKKEAKPVHTLTDKIEKDIKKQRKQITKDLKKHIYPIHLN